MYVKICWAIDSSRHEASYLNINKMRAALNDNCVTPGGCWGPNQASSAEWLLAGGVVPQLSGISVHSL